MKCFALQGPDKRDGCCQSIIIRRAVENLAAMRRRPWKIPEAVEKGFEIPIMITNSFAAPDIGKFKRLRMDVVVNAVWLAYYWAKKEGTGPAVTALEKLIQCLLAALGHSAR